MTTERRRSPRRTVVSVEKLGKWGSVTYVHNLSCGHIETRKRLAQSGAEIACTWCLKTGEIDKELKSLTKTKPSFFFSDDLINEEVQIEKTRSALSSAFGIPLEAVDVVAEDLNGQLIIRNARIYLSAQDVARLTRLM